MCFCALSAHDHAKKRAIVGTSIEILDLLSVCREWPCLWFYDHVQVRLDAATCVDMPPEAHLAHVRAGCVSLHDHADLPALSPSLPFWRPFIPAIDAFAAFAAARAPEEKRDLLILVAKALFKCVQAASAHKPAKPGASRRPLVAVDADSILGLFCYLAVHSCVPSLFAQVRC